ncbi:MAG TPA: DUF1080 domain-containing protein [Vicinamibacterales bacterium]
MVTTRQIPTTALMLLAAGLLLPAAAPAQTGKNATPLFNGRDLAGWKTSGSGWRADAGEIRHEGAAGTLTSERELGDAEIQAEYFVGEGGRAQILLKGKGLLDLKASPGTWHKLDIVQVGDRTTVFSDRIELMRHTRFLNGNEPLPPKGPLVLQADGDVRWRGLTVRDIPAAEANAILAKHDAEGFTPIFNGKDFTGWAGPTENYQVVDGALMCRPGKGGTIYTTREYRDFVVRLEFKLPPAGNNGLAIRYPGQGDTAYVGMTELQVLDNTSEKYAKLDPRQMHGSAYGMVAAKVGYLRPVGEWNFQEVTVKGSRITVELNGTVILDADLKEATEFLDNRPHPGKDRTSGHFGFAGHGDPVQFRNVAIREIQ